MSEPNVDLHERVVAAIQAREVPEDLLAPLFRMENHVSAVTDYAYHGAMGLRDWMSDIFEVFAEGVRYEVEELIAAEDDYVVAAFRLHGRGARSHEPLTFRWVGVTWFRNGKATLAIGYPSLREAMEAVAAEREGAPPVARGRPETAD